MFPFWKLLRFVFLLLFIFEKVEFFFSKMCFFDPSWYFVFYGIFFWLKPL